jgi:hypothetical protein
MQSLAEALKAIEIKILQKQVELFGSINKYRYR